MKPNSAGLSRRYATALRNYLKRESHAGLLAALRLGREAVALGLAALELTRIHKQALAILEPASRHPGLAKRAELFFANAAAPIVEARRAEGSNQTALDRLDAMTTERTTELAAMNRQLQRGVHRREVIDGAGQKSAKEQDKCLGEALELQKRLQTVAHEALAAQEDDRKNISHELHDEIAQTLLGVNVRLLSLKRKARTDPTDLKNEIASTRLLVVESAKSVRRLARELHKHPPAHGDHNVPGP